MALARILRKAKADRVSTAIGDLTICGAIPPYNEVLGGKLLAMLMMSPEVVAEYRRRYAGVPSMIASSMAGRFGTSIANLDSRSWTNSVTINAMKIATIEPGNRIQLPAEWAEALGLKDMVVLDKTGEAIVVRPCTPATWDEIFASKLAIGRPAPGPDEVEVSGDDLLF